MNAAGRTDAAARELLQTAADAGCGPDIWLRRAAAAGTAERLQADEITRRWGADRCAALGWADELMGASFCGGNILPEGDDPAAKAAAPETPAGVEQRLLDLLAGQRRAQAAADAAGAELNRALLAAHLDMGWTKSEMGRMLGISHAAVHYRIGRAAAGAAATPAIDRKEAGYGNEG